MVVQCISHGHPYVLVPGWIIAYEFGYDDWNNAKQSLVIPISDEVRNAVGKLVVQNGFHGPINYW